MRTVANLSIGLLLVFPSVVCGQLAAVVPPPVDHPVAQPASLRTPYAWRTGSGAWGETFADQLLRLRGFNQVLEVKRPGGQGIDRLGLKHDAFGKLIDVIFVEVKTRHGGDARLSSTRRGNQLSKEWLIGYFRDMQRSGDARLQTLIHEIHAFRRQKGLSIPDFVTSHAELHVIDTRAGQYFQSNPLTGAHLSNSTNSYLLRDIRRSGAPDAQLWATRSLDYAGQIKSTNEAMWLNRRAIARARVMQHATGSGLANAAAATSGKSLRRLVRIAGPIGSAAALAMDSYEIYSVVRGYRGGELNQRQMVVALAHSSGGIAGAGAGAATGAWIGGFGGPAAWITVPVGATAGGLAGYFAGSATSGYAANAWFSEIDENVKQKLDLWIIRNPYPGLKLRN